MIQFLKDFFTNYVLMSAIFAWLLAQLFKIFTGRFVDKKKNIVQLLTATGGMPSSHAATVMALLTSVIIKDGVSSTYAAICAILTIVVLVDATGVRRETGLQGAILNRMIANDESGTYDDFTKGFRDGNASCDGAEPFCTGNGLYDFPAGTNSGSPCGTVYNASCDWPYDCTGTPTKVRTIAF